MKGVLSSVCTEAVQRAVLKARNLHVLIVGYCNVVQASHRNNLAILKNAHTANRAVQIVQTQCSAVQCSADAVQTVQT